MIIDASEIINGKKKVTLESEVVIIGSGAGGSVAAYELSKSGLKVIVIEEGKKYSGPDFQRDCWEAVKKTYRDLGMFTTIGSPPIPIPLGKTLGGTTMINSGTCFRTPPEIIQKWNTEYKLNIKYNELIKHFESIEKMIYVQEVPEELMGSNNILFKKGAKKIGLNGFPLKRNAKNCKGAGLCVFGCPNNAKQSVNLNYLPESSKNGAIIITSLKAEKIIVKNNICQGIECKAIDEEKNNFHKITIYAKIIIIACGAIYTPYLLLKNKLCNSSGQVGKNLRIHPAAKILALFKDKINSWSGVPQAYCVDSYSKEGIIFEGFFLPPSFLSIALPTFGYKLKELMKYYSNLAGFGVMVSDTSTGRIYSIGNKPIIYYKLNEEDKLKFIKGIKIAAKVYFSVGALKVYLPIHNTKYELENEDELDHINWNTISPSDLELIAFHPMGTCRMGNDPKKSVVNEYLETHDIKNLFITDASIFPTSLGVNPQVSIMAFSRRTSHYIINNF
ncbi:MAG: oxidoreductase [Leptospiraceae bacterium]|nr:MAG: oxidoreductase [Leptospiraceae bacterium]